MSTFSRIAGTGSYLPEQRLTNQDLVERLAKIGLETSDEWIVTRSGISARHFAADNQLTSDLAVKAAQAALETAGYTSEDLDLIILATSTPDHLGGFPSTACVVQDKLGAHTNCAAFDVQAVCAGFTYALAIADAFIRTGTYKKVLVLGA
ncbi:MAG: 3-oxoacyl-ACP synthase, partial [Polynucleobacter sp. 24-46-87]